MTFLAYFATMTVLWGGIAVLGGLVAAYSLMAYRRQRSRPMLLLASGLMLLSVVPGIMWLGLYAFTDNVYSTSMLCAGVMLGGFALLVVSVRSPLALGRDPPPEGDG